MVRFTSKIPKETYPLIAAVAVASGYAGYMGYHHLVKNPDVVINKKKGFYWVEKSDQIKTD